MAANLPSRSARQAYDPTCAVGGKPPYYQEFIQMYPHDPLCDHSACWQANLVTAQAWHKAVLLNSPLGYKTFYSNYFNSMYARVGAAAAAAAEADPADAGDQVPGAAELSSRT